MEKSALDVTDRTRQILEAHASEAKISVSEAEEEAYQRGLKTLMERKGLYPELANVGSRLLKERIGPYRNYLVELGAHGLEIDRLERSHARLKEDLPTFIREAFRAHFEGSDVRPSDEAIESYVEHFCSDGGQLFAALIQKGYLPDQLAAALSDYWGDRAEAVDRTRRLEDPDPLVMQEVSRLASDSHVLANSALDARSGLRLFRLAWLLAARHTPVDAHVESVIMGFCISWGTFESRHVKISSVARALVQTLLSSSDFMKFISEGARWYACAMPVVRVEAKMAAALIFTDLPPDVVDASIKLPWPCFKILPMDDCLGGENPVRDISVHAWRRDETSPPRLRMTVYFKDHATCLTREVPSLSRLATLSEDEDEDDMAMIGMTKSDIRTMSLCGKLVIGTCLRMSDPESVRKRSPAAVKASGYLGPARSSTSPTATEFVLTGTVKVDLRKELSDYASGRPGFRYKKVQWLVRGHWRNQAHGPGRSERKVIWIEPFFKGSENAPIAVKTHVLNDSSKSGSQT